jgi:hypothetical protein
LFNGPGYITGITSGNVTGALGYTPLNNAAVSGSTGGNAGAAGPELFGVGGGAAMMSFHRPGSFACNFGLDVDNVLRIGGWSMGTGISHRILHEGILAPLVNRGVGSYLAVYVTAALGTINQDTAAGGAANRCIQDMGSGNYWLTSAGHIGGNWYARGQCGVATSWNGSAMVTDGRYYLFMRGS